MRGPGRRIDKVFVVLDGEAYSFMPMPGRARQIVDVAVRGEALNVAGPYRDEETVGFGSFGPCTLLAISKASLRRLLRADERLRGSFDRMIADEVAALTDRLASIGRQPALQRLAAFALQQAMRRGGAGRAGRAALLCHWHHAAGPRRHPGG